MTAIAQHQTSGMLARWAHDYAQGEPGTAVESIFRQRLLDFATSVVGGAAMPPSRALDPFVSRFPGHVPVPAGTAGAEAAALAYGIAAHSLECDDTHQPSSSHPGAVVFPAALTLAVELDATLDAVARAAVTGYEVMCGIGEAAGPAEQYKRGFHPTGTCGVFGATTAAGVLLDLGVEELAAAIGLAASCSSGSMSFLRGGGWSKLLNAGHAASAGIAVARLVGLGYLGPAEGIEAPHGFLAGHTDAEGIASIRPPSGAEPLAIERTSTKAHGCCRYEQGPIDAILRLRAEHRFSPAEVEAVRIGILSAGWGIVAEPLEAKRRPTSIVESQFSMPYGAALAIVRGRAAPADHNEANLVDAEILRLCDLVECYKDPELDALYPDRWPAVVHVRLVDGTELEDRVDYPKGDPENPFGSDELLDKLRTLAPEVGPSDVDRLSSLVLQGDLSSVPASALVDCLASMWDAVRARTA